MTTLQGVYITGRSWLYQLDPRVKLWISALGIVFSIVVSDLWLLASLLIVAHIILAGGRIPLTRIGEIWRSILPVLILIMILQPLMVPGEGAILWSWGLIRLTESGLVVGLRYVLRVAGAAFMALIPILTTPLPMLVYAMHRLGLPYTWALMIGLALRYLTTLGELYTTISQAQETRGWDLSNGGLIKRLRAAVPTLIAMIIASLRLSDSLAIGLAARGFGLEYPRTSWQQIQMQPSDWMIWAISSVLFAIAVFVSLSIR